MSEEENAKMVEYLLAFGYADQKTADAMRKVPRELFVPPMYREQAYADYPLPIGYDQTISAPSIVAFMTRMLHVERGMKILEIGAGSGYQAAILAELVGEGGYIYTIERIPEIIEIAKTNLSKLKYRNISVIYGDGTLGHIDAAPYDRIIVTCGAPQIPQPLLDQLKDGGRMLIPVGAMFWQDLMLIEKIDGKIRQQPILPVMFVPLIGKYGYKEYP
jgi:protein-L-isoaspartate(D-aspartate) O-methyltransferase